MRVPSEPRRRFVYTGATSYGKHTDPAQAALGAEYHNGDRPDTDPHLRADRVRPGCAVLDWQRPDAHPGPHAGRDRAHSRTLDPGYSGRCVWGTPRNRRVGDDLGPDRPDLG